MNEPKIMPRRIFLDKLKEIFTKIGIPIDERFSYGFAIKIHNRFGIHSPEILDLAEKSLNTRMTKPMLYLWGACHRMFTSKTYEEKAKNIKDIIGGLSSQKSI